MELKKAIKRGILLRMALVGPTGSGKTFSSLKIGEGILLHLKAFGKTIGNGKMAVIDSERKSAEKYADIFEFDTIQLDSYHPQRYLEALRMLAEQRYTVAVIDSLTHAWSGKDGILELVDKKKSGGGSDRNFGAWRSVSPIHAQFVDGMLDYPFHLITTMRSKMTYQVEEYEEDGKKRTRVIKLGLQPVQRDDLEYEFDIVGDMDQDNNLTVTKTRCADIARSSVNLPGHDLAKTLVVWSLGVDKPDVPIAEVPVAPLQPIQPAPTAADAKKRTAQALKEELTALERALGGREALLAVIGTYPANLEAAKRAVQVARDALAARVDESGEAFGEEPPPASEPPAERADPPPPEAPLESVGERQATLDLAAPPASIGVVEFWKAMPSSFRRPDGTTKIEVNDLFGQANAANLSGELRAVLLEIAHADLTIDAIATDLTNMFHLEKVRENAFKNVGDAAWVSYGDMLRTMRLKPATNAA